VAGLAATWVLATAPAHGAERILEAAEAGQPETATTCVAGRGPAAAEACRSALRQALTPVRTRRLESALAAHLLESGDTAGAVSIHRMAVQARPQDASAWVRLGETLFHAAGQPAESEQALLEATRLAPAQTRAWVTLGLVRNALGRHGDALQAFSAAEALDPTALTHRPAARLAQASSRAGRVWPEAMPSPPLP
jgi:tetratricopeptide (TPR) repeat protein